MKYSNVLELAKFCALNFKNLLITSAPGNGKTSLVKQVAQEIGYNLIIAHPVTDEPSDYKGLPIADPSGKSASFVPFGTLLSLMEATEPTIFFIDDIGQASQAVQSALMQLLLAREINGKKISDKVTFIAATNRKQDKAGVTGILEPVKSRFSTIVELEADILTWSNWAISQNLPPEFIAFIRFRPHFLTAFEATRDMTNSPTPRTIAQAGEMLRDGLPKPLWFEALQGAAGAAFTAELLGFLELAKELPDVRKIFTTPYEVEIPEKAALLYALQALISSKLTIDNVDTAMQYINRMPTEYQVTLINDAVLRNAKICETAAVTTWINDNHQNMAI